MLDLSLPIWAFCEDFLGDLTRRVDGFDVDTFLSIDILGGHLARGENTAVAHARGRLWKIAGRGRGRRRGVRSGIGRGGEGTPSSKRHRWHHHSGKSSMRKHGRKRRHRRHHPSENRVKKGTCWTEKFSENFFRGMEMESWSWCEKGGAEWKGIGLRGTETRKSRTTRRRSSLWSGWGRDTIPHSICSIQIVHFTSLRIF